MNHFVCYISCILPSYGRTDYVVLLPWKLRRCCQPTSNL